MKFIENSNLDKVLNSLIIPYKKRVAAVNKVIQGMLANKIISSEEDIINDHIAFRTLGVQFLGISSLEKIFLNYGYQKKDYYNFPEKKLNAYWYSHPDRKYPRIFISELRVSDLTPTVQEIIYKYTNRIQRDPVDDLDLGNVKEVINFFRQSLWIRPTLEDYNQLKIESEYAAWVIYNRYYLNHFTISVHDLPNGFNTLEDFNSFIKTLGVRLNTAGGEIKNSRDGLLRQSSSVADTILAEFENDNFAKIPGSYIEFAERLILPEFESLESGAITSQHRRDGFEASNADKIFESTYQSQQ